MSEIESLYYTLLNSGQLLETYPELKGEWLKDKKIFSGYYEDNQKILKDDYLNFDSLEDEDYQEDLLF